MTIDPDELSPKKRPTEIALGGDLSAMSEHELAQRIVSLETEIARCREAILERKSTKAAADAFFRQN
jgi:uncharacterized small protein (DUF1192 family)